MSQPRMQRLHSTANELEIGSNTPADRDAPRRSAGGWTQSGLYADQTDDAVSDDPFEDETSGDTASSVLSAEREPSYVASDSNALGALWGQRDERVAASHSVMDADALWRKTLGELQLQLASSTYYTWLHNTWIVAYEDGDLIVGTANTYARDWLDNRLKNIIRRTLKSIAGRTLDVQFVVSSRESGERQDRIAGMAKENPAAIHEESREESRAANPRFDLSTETASRHTSPATHFVGAKSDPAATRTVSGARGALAGVRLNPQYTFAAFVVGSNNRLASAAAQAVAERPGYKFNPLFVHGGVGLGKTHLLHAIGNALVERGLNVLYVTSEQFTNDLIGAIRAQNTEQFRARYRALDALLIDDIQFIAGKESTQEEFFHTFNHLEQLGKQVVLSSDRPPRALHLLEERLRSRFEGGIRVDVSAPDYETRVAILQSKAQRMGIKVEADVLSLVAQRVDSNIRELEGALNHLFLQAQMERTQLSLEMASSSLAHVAPHRKPCDPTRLIDIVARHLHLLPEDITGSRRTKSVADARHVAMYLLREDSALSLPQIGALFGGRDHSTVAHGVAKITSELQRDESLRNTIAVLRERIYA